MYESNTTKPAVMKPAALFLSSGDVLADRRYERAQAYAADGDRAAAADLLVQAVERAPGFASAWFALGEIRAAGGDRAGAIAAFDAARAADPSDRHGAALQLARLGAADPAAAMTPGYLRSLFDQYAPNFDHALVAGLGYRGPVLLREALRGVAAARGLPFHFARALDLGCGSGILALALAAASPARVLAVDVDPRAAAIAAANARRNEVGAQVRAAEADGFKSRAVRAGAPYDLVLANILARPLERMAKPLAASLAPRGTAILSGLLARQEREVLAAYRAQGLALAARLRVEGWTTLAVGRA